MRFPVTIAYDSRGRLASTTQRTRQTSYIYGADGLLASATDPLGRKTSFTYDAVGQLASVTLPGGQIIRYAHDGNGNVTSITPPGRTAHRIAYTEVDQPASYTPPIVAGTGATLYTYDLDRNLTRITRPDSHTIIYGYDVAGRLTSATLPTAVVRLAYDATTGHLASAANGTETIAYSYSGRLPTESALIGVVAGDVARGFSNDFFVTAQTINGANGVTFGYDRDGLTTQAGALTIQRRAADGLIVGTTLGVVVDSRTYNGYGELVGYTASIHGSPIWTVTYTRDAGGRITQKSETIRGTVNSYSYTYDGAGRLASVVKNSTTDSYSYGANANRLTGTLGGVTSTGTYDAQDRLTNYGGTSYAYNANGDLTSRTAAAQTTRYSYDVLGNLIGATLPSGRAIAYVVDAENHRVGKKVNGVLQAGFLYDDDAVIAQLNGANHIAKRFVYGTSATTPDYAVIGSTNYRILSDERGSPVLVVNATTGAVAQQITYDEFGNVLADTNPAAQPFRFAGGLYDTDTKLVRFGARDYDPSIGRWTAKDPTRFDGGDMNLYNYALGDPVNGTDPTGLGALCDKIKKKVIEKGKKMIEDKTKTIKVGPIDVHTDRPAISKTVSVELQVEGQTIASVDATAEVGITPSHNPSDPIFQLDLDGNVKVGKWVIWHGEVHKEFGDPTQMPTSRDFRKEIDRAEKALCTDNCGTGQGLGD